MGFAAKNLAVGVLVLGLFLGGTAGQAAQDVRCTSNNDCQSPGMWGVCQDPGTANARCIFQEYTKVELTVIVSQECLTCNTDELIARLKTVFPGLEAKSVAAQSPEGQALIKKLKINTLPAYVLSKDVERAVNFAQFRQTMDLVGDHYYLKPEVTGVSLFLDRERKKGQLDLFISLTGKGSYQVMKLAEEIAQKRGVPTGYRLVAVRDEEKGDFYSLGGMREINEAKAYACVHSLYPKKATEYLMCRTKSIDSMWWEDCLVPYQMDPKAVKDCAKSAQANDLLAKETALAQELKIIYSPLFLLENDEIFGVTEETTADEVIGLFGQKPKE